MNTKHGGIPKQITKTTDPKTTVTTFVLLCLLFSSLFWYLIAQLPSGGKDQTRQTLYTVGVMWCPAVAQSSLVFGFSEI